MCDVCVPKDTAGAENELDADATTDSRSVGSTEGSACAIRDFESYCSGCMAKDTVVAADKEAASLNTKCSLFVVKSTKGLEKKLDAGVTPDVTTCDSKCIVSLTKRTTLAENKCGAGANTGSSWR
ncbi:hypothetical protein F442_18310 [Phytophthora nicotianae P10297]|uniref:Uncharacterized protein n=1 Tax=Phytophthora nicotianae P10297 TaxID=1317064 RepID=W2YFY4_PHYNI|nr:hypothetical protein F442_18310 [Phytophthora nicotianae P10297]